MSTAKEKKYAREYYKEHPKYRKKKIEDRKAEARNNKTAEAAYSRKYYATHPEYRRYKIAYSRRYRRSHKQK